MCRIQRDGNMKFVQTFLSVAALLFPLFSIKLFTNWHVSNLVEFSVGIALHRAIRQIHMDCVHILARNARPQFQKIFDEKSKLMQRPHSRAVYVHCTRNLMWFTIIDEYSCSMRTYLPDIR